MKSFLLVEVPTEKNGNTVQVTQYNLDDENEVFKQWYKLIGNDCNALDRVVTSNGHIYVDDVGLYKKELTQSLFTTVEGQLQLSGNMIIVKGQYGEDITYFDENEDGKLLSFWQRTFAEARYFRGEK